jgi:murein DD-endopeptidase MepM/ murein hydrolase activator NlpD
MLPDVGAVADRATNYYNAAVAQGRPTNRMAMQTASAKFGTTKTGMSDQIAEYMSRQGVTFSSNANSQYGKTQTSIANAVSYLNMDPMAATKALTDLNSGGTSANMMRNFGIMTSDPTTGRAMTQNEIFEQLHQRLTAGREQATVEDVQNSYLRGNLGETLRQSGLSEDQQQMYYQFALQKAGGTSMDLSNDAQMKGLSAGQTAAGNENPLESLYKQNQSKESLFQDFEQPYIEGIKEATGYIQTFNEVLKMLPDEVKQFNAMISTLMGDKGIGGLVSAIGPLIGVVASLVIGITSAFSTIRGILKMFGIDLPGGTPKTGTPEAKPKGGATPKPGASAPKPKGKGGNFLDDVVKNTGNFLDDMGKGMGKILPNLAKGASWISMVLSMSGDTKKSDAEIESQPNLFDPSTWRWGFPEEKKSSPTQPPTQMSPIPGLPSGQNTNTGTPSWVRPTGGLSSSVGTGATTPAQRGKMTFIMPANGKIVDGFGPRKPFMTDSGQMSSSNHDGIDIDAGMGATIVASASGTVIHSGWNGGYGNTVKIDHGNGYVTLYAHMSQLGASNGAKVTQGQQIGKVGSTGNSTGPHLHFSVYLNGRAIDPMTVLSGGAVVSTGTPETSSPAQTASAMVMSQDQILSGVSAKTPDFAKASGLTSSGNSSRGMSSTSRSNSSSSGKRGYMGSSGSAPSGRQNAMYLPDAKSAKTGDSYVAQDGPVNVHTGEAILTSAQADVWRDAIKQGYGGRGRGGNNVTINLTIGEASQAEAQKFAETVKRYLEDDNLLNNMARS